MSLYIEPDPPLNIDTEYSVQIHDDENGEGVIHVVIGGRNHSIAGLTYYQLEPIGNAVDPAIGARGVANCCFCRHFISLTLHTKKVSMLPDNYHVGYCCDSCVHDFEQRKRCYSCGKKCDSDLYGMILQGGIGIGICNPCWKRFDVGLRRSLGIDSNSEDITIDKDLSDDMWCNCYICDVRFMVESNSKNVVNGPYDPSGWHIVGKLCYECSILTSFPNMQQGRAEEIKMVNKARAGIPSLNKIYDICRNCGKTCEFHEYGMTYKDQGFVSLCEGCYDQLIAGELDKEKVKCVMCNVNLPPSQRYKLKGLPENSLFCWRCYEQAEHLRKISGIWKDIDDPKQSEGFFDD